LPVSCTRTPWLPAKKVCKPSTSMLKTSVLCPSSKTPRQDRANPIDRVQHVAGCQRTRLDPTAPLHPERRSRCRSDAVGASNVRLSDDTNELHTGAFEVSGDRARCDAAGLLATREHQIADRQELNLHETATGRLHVRAVLQTRRVRIGALRCSFESHLRLVVVRRSPRDRERIDSSWPPACLREGPQRWLRQGIGSLIPEGIHPKATESAFVLVDERTERWR